MFAIEKNVPAPVGGSKYPFAEMDIGDSFLFPFADTGKINSAGNMFAKKASKALVAAKSRSKTVAIKFRTKKITATEARCWRIR